MVMWLQKILVIFSCFSANLAALSDAQAPDIIDVPSLIPAGEDLDLKCRSTVGLHSLRWIYPKNALYADYQPLEGRLSSRNIPGEASATLSRTNMVDSGIYTCLDEDTQQSRSIFVSVKDPDNSRILLRFNESQLHIEAVEPQLPDQFIRCLSSNPDATVTLWLGGNRIPFNYIQGKGFLFQNGTSMDLLQQPRPVTCKADLKGSSTDSINFQFMILATCKAISKPNIDASSAEFAYVTGQLSLSCMENFERSDCFGECVWSFPAQADGPGRFYNNITAGANYKNQLTLKALIPSDAGNYSCRCWNRNNFQNENFLMINISQTRGQIDVKSMSNSTQIISNFTAAYFEVKYSTNVAESQLQTKWYHEWESFEDGHQRKEIVADGRISDSHQRISPGLNNHVNSIKILDSVAADSGNYTLWIQAWDLEREFHFELFVRSPIFVSIDTSLPETDFRYLEQGHEYHLACIGNGYPLENVTWYWKPCLFRESCLYLQIFGPANNNVRLGYDTFIRKTYQIGLNLTTVAEYTGTYRCFSASSGSEAFQEYIVTDVPDSVTQQGLGIIVEHDAETVEVLEGDYVELQCRAQKYDYVRVHWERLLDGVGEYQHSLDSIANANFKLSEEDSVLSKRVNVIFDSVKKEDSASYFCYGERLGSSSFEGRQKRQSQRLERTYKLEVGATKAPYFLNDSISKFFGNYSDQIQLSCFVDGLPKPTVVWRKGGQPLRLRSGMSLLENNQVLKIETLVGNDAGEYECVAENRVKNVSKSMQLEVIGAPGDRLSHSTMILLGILISIAVIAVFALVVTVFIFKRREMQRLSLLNELYRQLMDSTKNQNHYLDPNIPIHQQTDQIPYDIRYEIPKNRLVMQKTLGEGQFGKVVRGQLDTEPPMDVAVKMPRDGLSVLHQRALLDELKIMIYLGQHPNILGLVGAVTKHIGRGELYVCMEFCEHGCLLDVLKSRRNSFIDELKNSPLGRQIPDNSGYMLPNSINFLQSQKAGIAQKCYASELDPNWESSLDQYRRDGKWLATSDLLNFAYQTASGMCFLASKKLIHRDLAARNILLTAEGIVKICDFGLARQDPNYTIKKQDVPLPIRWMAIEAVKHKEHTVATDVWAFGVTLWEFFTLGQLPYHECESNPAMWNFVNSGGRLDQPIYCPESVYRLMAQCWLTVPNDRPNFEECRQRLRAEFRRCAPNFWMDVDRLLAQPVPEYSNLFHVDDEGSSINGDYLPPKITANLGFRGYRPAAQQDPDSPRAIAGNDLYMEPDVDDDDVMIEMGDIKNGSGARNNSYVIAQNRPRGGMSTTI